MAWLVCTSGDDRGMAHAVSEAPLTIGRAQDADLRIVDDRSSRYHCRVQVKRGKLLVEDLESTNGVKFKGKRYQGKSIRLSIGESFAIGSDVFTFSKSKDILSEAAEEIMDELSRHRDKGAVVDATYAEAMTAEMKRRKKKKPGFFSRLFGNGDA